MKFRRDEGIEAPTKAHQTDAGYDLYSPVDLIIEGRSFSHRIDLGVGFEVPLMYCGYIVERSSQGKVGVNAIGPVVDHGYTGNVHVTLVNNQDTPYQVKKGDRIAQMLLLRIGMEELEEVETLEGERGDHGHGSTGA